MWWIAFNRSNFQNNNIYIIIKTNALNKFLSIKGSVKLTQTVKTCLYPLFVLVSISKIVFIIILTQIFNYYLLWRMNVLL